MVKFIIANTLKFLVVTIPGLYEFLYNGTNEEIYEHINRMILDGNVMNMSLVITKGKYGDIDTDDYSCHGYYIIKFFSSLYTLQADLIIDGQIISYGEVVCEGTDLFPINVNYNYYDLQRTKFINTIASLSKIINGNGNVICYDLKDVFPPCLRFISQNYYNTLSPLYTPMKDQDHITDEKNQRESIESEILVSIGMQDNTYDYNYDFWDSI